MKKLLARIGIGAATVDTVLPSTTVTPGETVDAEIHINGGSAEQEISAIDLALKTRYETDDSHTEGVVDWVRLSEGITIEPDQDETRTTPIEIPVHTPVTIDRVDVWVETELEIDLAVDPETRNHLDVQPPPRMQALFDATDDLGFSLRHSDCLADRCDRYTSSRPFVQAFEFRSQSGPYAGRVDELELICSPGADTLTVFVEVGRHGVSEMADTDERSAQFTVDSTDRDEVAEQLREILDRYA